MKSMDIYAYIDNIVHSIIGGMYQYIQLSKIVNQFVTLCI